MNPTSPTPELLPCPFCGEKAAIKTNKTTMVSCTACSAAVFQKLDDIASAVVAWNTRAAPTTNDEDVSNQPITTTMVSSCAPIQSPPSVAAGMKSAEEWGQYLHDGNRESCGPFTPHGFAQIVKRIQHDALTAERARVEKLREALQVVSVLIWRDKKMNACGLKAGEALFVHAIEAALNEDNHGGDDA